MSTKVRTSQSDLGNTEIRGTVSSMTAALLVQPTGTAVPTTIAIPTSFIMTNKVVEAKLTRRAPPSAVCLP
ncbi:MAG TPA: hypothetical protein VMU99_06630 [Acidimicrobiales bacterium]|nr:hypothetical protein [Acidimicrobiales bacterium]